MVIMLIVKPRKSITMKVAMIEVGIASATMNVPRRLCRKRKTISTASSAPSSSDWLTSCSVSLMKVD